MCNVLQDVGVGVGDRVIVILPRLPEWWLVNIACLKLGAILSPGTTSLTSQDILKRVNTSEAVCVITTPDVAKCVDQVFYLALESIMIFAPAASCQGHYSNANAHNIIFVWYI